MDIILSVIVIVLNLTLVVLMVVLLTKGSSAERFQERTERVVKDEIARNREELNNSLKSSLDTFLQQLAALAKTNEEKLEQIRGTVDEKLHSTLEKRLGESFKRVSEQLESVHKGLGEMQSLASGVGDLKRMLTNVKTRGTWGEIQLGNLLEQILMPEQYAINVSTKKGCSERVEFAIKLPGRDEHRQTLWLPIDAKFPLEDYQKLSAAQEQTNATLVEELGKALETRIKSEARDIRDKYLDPPHTTDFGIMYLPIEGLYAEVLRRPGLFEILQREYRVVVTGPTTLSAILNGLQMGFRTLAIEKRSSEVWELLGIVKNEFGKFGETLDKTYKKLQEASHNLEDATRKSRTIERKLRNVQQLPSGPAHNLCAGQPNLIGESCDDGEEE